MAISVGGAILTSSPYLREWHTDAGIQVLINAVNLFLQVFFTIMYSDLEWYFSPRLFTPFDFESRRLAIRISFAGFCYQMYTDRTDVTVTTSTLSISATVSTHTLYPKLPSMAS